MADLTDRVALVTGASAGFGASISELLAARGATVVLASRRLDRLEEIAGGVEAGGGRAVAVSLDVTDADQVRSVVAGATERFGRLDIAVNSAGIDVVAPFDTFDLADFDRVMEVNTRGLYLCCRAEFEAMKPAGTGHIINISSVAGFRGYPGQAAYVASKHAVHGLSRVLAVEAQPFGIGVSLISPAAADTELGRANNPQLAVETLIAPGDVARTVEYLVSLSPTAMVDEVYLRRRVDPPF